MMRLDGYQGNKNDGRYVWTSGCPYGFTICLCFSPLCHTICFTICLCMFITICISPDLDGNRGTKMKHFDVLKVFHDMFVH
jgi:hypothetical protein